MLKQKIRQRSGRKTAAVAPTPSPCCLLLPLVSSALRLPTLRFSSYYSHTLFCIWILQTIITTYSSTFEYIMHIYKWNFGTLNISFWAATFDKKFVHSLVMVINKIKYVYCSPYHLQRCDLQCYHVCLCRAVYLCSFSKRTFDSWRTEDYFLSNHNYF